MGYTTSKRIRHLDETQWHHVYNRGADGQDFLIRDSDSEMSGFMQLLAGGYAAAFWSHRQLFVRSLDALVYVETPIQPLNACIGVCNDSPETPADRVSLAWVRRRAWRRRTARTVRGRP
jgi:hypothetical protein